MSNVLRFLPFFIILVCLYYDLESLVVRSLYGGLLFVLCELFDRMQYLPLTYIDPKPSAININSSTHTTPSRELHNIPFR